MVTLYCKAIVRFVCFYEERFSLKFTGSSENGSKIYLKITENSALFLISTVNDHD